MSTPDLKAHGTTLAALKGLAITSSLLYAGQLATITTFIPSLYPTAQTSHREVAQIFAHQYRSRKVRALVSELVSGVICGGLAYVGYSDSGSGSKWKLWTAAAGCVFAIRPWSFFFMESPAQKLLWVSEVAHSASRTREPASTGIGVQITTATPGTSPPPGPRSSLGLPLSQGGKKGGAITPMEEFEPFEDAPMDEREYEQLKVMKLLKTWNWHNGVRTVLPLGAGVMSLWAVLTE